MRSFNILLSLVLLLVGSIPSPKQPTSEHTPVYISPAPFSRNISTQTSIALRQGEPFATDSIAPDLFLVSGSASGEHTGEVRLSDDRRTILFYPKQPFSNGETVSVKINSGLRTTKGTKLQETIFEFHTLDREFQRKEIPENLEFENPSTNNLMDLPGEVTYRTYPDLQHVMPVTVTTPASNVGDGFIFITARGGGLFPYPSLMILDNEGQPLYIKETPVDLSATDFKKQIANGESFLTYHTGESVGIWTEGTYYVMDDAYQIVDTWTIGNGYLADMHGMQLLENGNALLFNYTPIPVDLSPYGGPVDGVVMDIVVQEQDPSKNVIFEWHASQHIPLEDTYQALDQSPVDYMHTNAIELDWDGNILISNRHLSEITKIDRLTGEIIWRLGGKQNQFTFTNDDGFTSQHDIRRLPNGNITLFDNGNRKNPAYSRGVEFTVDETAMTVTRVWQYPDDQSLFAPYMANMQRLNNGNTVFGWGAIPMVSEIRPDKSIAFEMTTAGQSYRAFRFDWEAIPLADPRLVINETGDASSAELYFGWNGATGIESYEVYAGSTPGSLGIVETVARTGFETTTTLNGLDESTCAFQVKPIHVSGTDMPESNLIIRQDLPQCSTLLPTHIYIPSLFLQDIPNATSDE